MKIYLQSTQISDSISGRYENNNRGIAMTSIQPLADYVVVAAKEKLTKTASGLYLPDSSSQESASVQVLAVGPEVKTVKTSDRVVYKNEHEAVKIATDGDDYYLIKLENIIAKVEEHN